MNCWFTGQGPVGGFDSEADVDGGETSLYSPFIDLDGLTDPMITYWRWFSNSTGANPSEDVMIVEISVNGLDWFEVEQVGPTGPGTSGQWIQHSFRSLDFVPLSVATQLRFRVSDFGAGSVVEAMIDDVRIRDLQCGPLDCNNNGTPDDLDISMGTSEDCDLNGVPDECDIAAGTDTDCNMNGIPDFCDVLLGAEDCDNDNVPDSCQLAAEDCNGNGIVDECDIGSGLELDCNGNGVPDACDIASGTSLDNDLDMVPDECQQPEFVRGDVDASGGVDIADAISTLGSFFAGTPILLCDVAIDVNGDAMLNIADPIYLLAYLFSGGPAPVPPFPSCGQETVPSGLDCQTFPA